jgi:dienelactone hydrolase
MIDVSIYPKIININFNPMQPKSIFLFASLTFCSLTSISQSNYIFKNGLAIGNVHQYGREALYQDALAFDLISGSLAPAAGNKMTATDGNSSTEWKTITADSTGVFRGRDLGNGYLFLQYDAPKSTIAKLIVTGHSMLYFNGVPHAGDQYRYGWMHIPVQLKKGKNEVLIRAAGMGRFGAVSARLEFIPPKISIQTADATLPMLVEGEGNKAVWAGLVVLNAKATDARKLSIKASIGDQQLTTTLPSVNGMMSRKVPVQIPVPSSVKKGSYTVSLSLLDDGKLIDTTHINISAVANNEPASHTFLSAIDGSVQYYAVTPQSSPTINPSLYFSVHGAEVEAISQARAYASKMEGPVVAPTNRRPRGFNWEDWGRLDAFEVLGIAKKQFNPDPQRIYLTGHSMGGHGTWYLGATYAGQWAAIAPCAGYPTMADYGSHDGKVPTSAVSPVKQQLIRAGNPGNTLKLANNYKASGVYIFHGDADPTVSVEYARQMKKLLADFHPDFSYYEYPGGSHWFGNESVDWPPLFDYFKMHKTPLSKDVNAIDFTTASVGISSTHHWIKIVQQVKPFLFSRVQLNRNLKTDSIVGTTENIQVLHLNLQDFNEGDMVSIKLDNDIVRHSIAAGKELTLVKHQGHWQSANMPPSSAKGEKRNGGFKEAFRHNMLFIFGTKGTVEENNWMLNKAKYDAETWYYRGNGAVDIIADTAFDIEKYKDRGIVLYGNMSNNAAATVLLKESPVKVMNGLVQIGNQSWRGDDLGSYTVWPHPANDHASVALIGGTGLKGMRSAEANQYYAGGSGFPDFMIFSLDMLKYGEKGLKVAGYFNNEWKLNDDFASVQRPEH